MTELTRTVWRVLLGITTIGSFLIGVYTLVSDADDSDGLPTKVAIKGTGHDIDVYPSGPVSDRNDDGNGAEENEAGAEDAAPSVDSDGSSESSSPEEKPAN